MSEKEKDYNKLDTVRSIKMSFVKNFYQQLLIKKMSELINLNTIFWAMDAF